MTYKKENTNTPIPLLHRSIADDDAVYLVMENVEGMSMAELGDEQRATVQQELERNLQTMRSLRS